MIANDNVMGIDISIVWAYIYIYISIMWVKQCHKPSPSHHHVYDGG